MGGREGEKAKSHLQFTHSKGTGRPREKTQLNFITSGFFVKKTFKIVTLLNTYPMYFWEKHKRLMLTAAFDH